MRASCVAALAACACALGACKDKAPPRETPREPPVVPGDASRPIDTAATSLPADFPARGAPALKGVVSGQPFTLAKAMLRKGQGGAALELYAWSDGGPCEPQFAPEPDQLYISAHFPEGRAAAGEVIQSSDRNTFVTFKKPDYKPIDETAVIVLDEIAGDRVTGRMTLAAPNDTNVSGTFTATMCASPQQPLDPPAPIHGLAYRSRPEPAKLPKQPVTGVLLGKPGAPVAIEVVDWQSEYAAQHEVHFYFTPPKKECMPDQLSPGFKIGFGKTIAAGVSASRDITTVTRTGEPWAAVLWEEPGSVVGMEGGGFLSAIIDSANATEVRGRVFAWFSDPSKSMLAGSFTAKRCKIDF